VAAVAFGVGAGVLFGLFTVLIRPALNRGGHAEVGAAVVMAIAFTVALAAAAVGGSFDSFHIGDLWPFFAIGCFVPGCSQILFIQSVRLAGPSRTAILVGCAPLVAAVIAILFLDEPVRAGLIAGTVFVVAGGIALVSERVRPADFRALGAAVALTCAFMFGIRDNLVRLAARDVHPPALLATAASLLGAFLVICMYLAIVRRDAIRAELRGAVVAFALVGVTLGAAYSFLVEGFAHGRVTLVSPLNATQSLWGVVCAAILLGRSEMIGRRAVLAGLLVVAGSVLISATR
jgi:drug/metabolite transporter (DMT)-like permease